MRGISCLYVLGRCHHERHVLRASHILIDVCRADVKFVGKILQIHGYILASRIGICTIVARHIVGVEVPVEVGFASLLQIGKQFLLHLLKQVETYEYVCVILEFYVFSCGNLSVYGTFISYALVSQSLVIVVIYVAEVTPQTQKSFLQLSLLVMTEVGKESFQQFALLISKIRQVVKLVYVLKVAEYLVGISHILVYVIKVGQQQLSPTIEVVERLVNARTLYKRLMQVAHQLYGVAHYILRVLAEEFADGSICRTPHRLASHTCHIFVHEQCGTLVRKHHHNA